MDILSFTLSQVFTTECIKEVSQDNPRIKSGWKEEPHLIEDVEESFSPQWTVKWTLFDQPIMSDEDFIKVIFSHYQGREPQ